MARRPLVMGNWKLNGSKAFTKELIEGLKAELQGVTGCDVAIAPPVMYLGDVYKRQLTNIANGRNWQKPVIH